MSVTLKSKYFLGYDEIPNDIVKTCPALLLAAGNFLGYTETPVQKRNKMDLSNYSTVSQTRFVTYLRALYVKKCV
jgi:hypothetical protein